MTDPVTAQQADDYYHVPLWGVVRADEQPWPRDEYALSTVDQGRVLVCDGPTDAAACTLHPDDPDTYPSKVVQWEAGKGWTPVDDHYLAMRVRGEEGRAKAVADAVEGRVSP